MKINNENQTDKLDYYWVETIATAKWMHYMDAN